jgi:tryptophan synthase alpha chain
VTGARDKVGSAAAGLVARAREYAGDLPVAVGLGVRSGDQAAEVAGFADAVVVGSAFVSKAGGGDQADRGVRELAAELADGVRRPLVAR